MALFIMACIGHGGLNTLYAFQQKTGLQPGSIRPVINELEKTGLLERSEGEKRGRRTMALTKDGETFVAAEWRKGLDAKREVESILRSATIALLMDDIGTALNFLYQSAVERERPWGPNEFGEPSLERGPIEFHTSSRAVYAIRRRSMEAFVLREIAQNLERSANGQQ